MQVISAPHILPTYKAQAAQIKTTKSKVVSIMFIKIPLIGLQASLGCV